MEVPSVEVFLDPILAGVWRGALKKVEAPGFRWDWSRP